MFDFITGLTFDRSLEDGTSCTQDLAHIHAVSFILTGCQIELQHCASQGIDFQTLYSSSHQDFNFSHGHQCASAQCHHLASLILHCTTWLNHYTADVGYPAIHTWGNFNDPTPDLFLSIAAFSVVPANFNFTPGCHHLSPAAAHSILSIPTLPLTTSMPWAHLLLPPHWICSFCQVVTW